jgi:hypothetical protein
MASPCLHRALALAAACAGFAACTRPVDPPPPPTPAFWSADWAKSYTQVRPCRKSIDHDLNNVAIYADKTAADSYSKRDKPFPDGSVILKAEYRDEECKTLTGFTAMRREKGFDPNNADWHWQKADAAMVVSQDGKIARCSGCHKGCGVPPDGFDWTCSVVGTP